MQKGHDISSFLLGVGVAIGTHLFADDIERALAPVLRQRMREGREWVAEFRAFAPAREDMSTAYEHLLREANHHIDTLKIKTDHLTTKVNALSDTIAIITEQRSIHT